MGITCSSDTANMLVKKTGKHSDRMVVDVLEFAKQHGANITEENFSQLLKEISQMPYVYLGTNKISHQLIQNCKKL